MRRAILTCLLSAVASLPGLAWNTAQHKAITQAALDSLAAAERTRLGQEAARLVDIYCMYPDRLQELEQFGFARNSPGPRDPAEIRPYSIRPDGEAIHSASWDNDEDLVSLVLLFERIARAVKAGETAEAAQFMGTLSHFFADSLSPPHAISAAELAELAGGESLPIHRELERTAPPPELKGRKPQRLGEGLIDSAQAALERLNQAAAENRKALPALLTALKTKDEAALGPVRQRAVTAAAALLADSLHTLFELAAR